MSATKTEVRPATFPTAEDLGEIERAFGAAYNAVEDLDVRLGRILDPWDESGEIVERPTFAAIGVLAEIANVVDSELKTMTEELNKVKSQLRRAMTMRFEVEFADRRGRDA